MNLDKYISKYAEYQGNPTAKGALKGAGAAAALTGTNALIIALADQAFVGGNTWPKSLKEGLKIMTTGNPRTAIATAALMIGLGIANERTDAKHGSYKRVPHEPVKSASNPKKGKRSIPPSGALGTGVGSVTKRKKVAVNAKRQLAERKKPTTMYRGGAMFGG
jgi:hypothetical protein